MKLEVGMYVRTKSGLIAKYIGYEKDEEDNEYSKYNFNGKIYWYYEYYNDYVYEEDFKEWFEESIIKTSYNIIDLIEVGDYVNGYKVIHRTKSLLGFEDGQDGDWYLSNENIKSIVTKEQFESIKYSLEG